MGFFALIVLAFLEIALAVKTCRKKSDRKTWRRDRLVIRATEALAIVLLYLFSAAQKWRFVPVLVFLAILLVIAALAMPAKRNQESRPKKPGAAVASCVLCILFFGLLLVPAVVFTDYNGLPVSGQYQVGESSAILIDSSRTDPL